MKITSLLVLVFMTFLGLSCTPTEQKAVILPREVFLDSINRPDVQLADIRTPEEYADEGNFPRAKNIDFLDDDFYEQMEENFNKDKPLYIHCKRGIKSHKSIKKLQQLGFHEIYELEGGFDDWQGEK